jgi:hypothetical protein
VFDIIDTCFIDHLVVVLVCCYQLELVKFVDMMLSVGPSISDQTHIL